MLTCHIKGFRAGLCAGNQWQCEVCHLVVLFLAILLTKSELHAWYISHGIHCIAPIAHETWKTHQLAPEICDCSFEHVNITHFNDWYCSTSYENSLRWMTKNLIYDKSTPVKQVACCCQATSHYLNQSWPKCITLYAVIKIWRVN